VNLTGDLLWSAPFGFPILGFDVIRSRCLRLAMFGALAAAMSLAACGRKGPLDPPPGGMILEPRSGMPAVTPRGTPRPAPAYDDQGRPIASEGPDRRLPLDWLLD
jgi:predicted small lipoprotein YifL